MGYKIINGTNTREICLNVFVDEKVSISSLTKNNIIPKTYMGIKTDVIRTGKFNTSSTPVKDSFSLQKLTQEISEKTIPLQGGTSISVGDRETEVTIGYIVVKKKLFKKDFFILSNNHVLADENRLSLGSVVIQPSEAIGGNFPKDVVAHLSAFVPIKFSFGIIEPKNYVDCAIAELTNKTLISDEIINIGKITVVAKPKLDEHIRKVGSMSGFTEGEITTVDLTTELYVPHKGRTILTKQIHAMLPNISGDSGSVVVNDNNQVIGLLFAGEDGEALINDINLVLKKLKVGIYVKFLKSI